MSEEAKLFQRILVAFDGSSASGAALATALALADELHAVVRVVGVVEQLPNIIGLGGGLEHASTKQAVVRTETEGVLARARELLDLSGVQGDTLALDAGGRGVASAIQSVALDWHADVIVIGTHGRRGAQRLVLGSVAESVARLSTIPVILVPHHATPTGASAPS
ncbi:universal stress protein [Cupriavidus numazuensis]|uniref:Stress response protein NhaX n=1 Tax=Cupriavidus numazuensis TaxID=221992 RepID=A0ABM8TVJ5_9BURK|nr:universal stress protein [Cupriavidus numazuensis]CAG2160690.1 Stress response protein NhaX [Cupriavidus numazuensis]